MLERIIKSLNEINEIGFGITVSLSKYDFKKQDATLIIISENSESVEITTMIVNINDLDETRFPFENN